MSDRQFDLDEIKEHLRGPTTSPLFLLDACRWMVDEVERLGQFEWWSDNCLSESQRRELADGNRVEGSSNE